MKYFRARVFAVSMTIVTVQAAVAAADEVETLMERAVEQYRAGNVQQTFVLLKQALELDPNHEGVLYRLCLLNIHLERFREAEPYCQTLVQKNPDNEDYRSNLHWSRTSENLDVAQACSERGDFDCAVRAAQKIVEVDPGVPGSHYFIGNIYVMRDSGRQDRLRAVAHLREAIRLHQALPAASEFALSAEELAVVYTGLGVTAGREGDHDLAVESFEKALQLDPDITDGWHNLKIARQNAKGRKSRVVWLSLADILGID